ncbi:MAG: GH92 family glycosyl hydrolase [Tepidisphaeraceae bacterium]
MRFHRLQLILLALLVATGTSRLSRAESPLDLVSTLQGTDSDIGFSHGGTLPVTGSPWAMTTFAPQTFDATRQWFEEGGWWFQSSAKTINGFRATHQASPWMGDYGFFSIMPVTGKVGFKLDDRHSEYEIGASTFRPDYVRIELKRYDVLAELTSSKRCAVMRFTYRKGETGRLMVDPARVAHLEVEGQTIRGYTLANNGGVPKNWKSYFVIRLDRLIRTSSTFDANYVETPDRKSVDGDRIGMAIDFDTPDDRRAVEVQVGTSYISLEQAELNLRREAEGGFDATRQRTASEWTEALGRIEIRGGTDAQRSTFYSCLFRALTYPHTLHELDAAGKPIHFSMYDGQIHDGPAYGDIGFWDVYRSNFSLWSIAYSEQLQDILAGFVQSYRESGWFPQWPSPGHRNGMVGSHVDAVFADAVMKNLGGFDVNAAYEGIRKNAFDKPVGVPAGRGSLDEYIQLGYLPADKGVGSGVSATLDYAYDDWCVAQVAKALGKTSDYEALMKRSTNYRHLWDPSVGFFRAKTSKGEWVGEFDPIAWGNGYVECGPWQGTWAVPHDVPGLAKLIGGNEKMAEKLDLMMGLPSAYHVGDVGQAIHEMKEMATQQFGQYMQGNQPDHHVLYLWAAIGQPWKTQYWTRRVCTDLYDASPRGFAGDEDNGEMSSWYVLSSMGLYQLCVGDPNYTLTSPLFDEVRINLPGNKSFTIRAKDNGPPSLYVLNRTLNGKLWTSETIPYATIMSGGELTAQMSERVPTDPRLNEHR